jgi:hypothetical protein
MSAFLPYVSSFSDAWDTQEPFEMVIAYEDLHAREQVSRLCERIEEQVGGQYQLQCSWWDLEDLGNVAFRKQAAAAASGAAMVILSLSSDDTLPEYTNAWIASWVPKKEEGKSALVVLINKQPSFPLTDWPVRTYLQNVARQARMDFFFHAADTVPELPCSLHGMRQRAERITPVLRESMAPRYARSANQL